VLAGKTLAPVFHGSPKAVGRLLTDAVGYSLLRTVRRQIHEGDGVIIRTRGWDTIFLSYRGSRSSVAYSARQGQPLYFNLKIAPNQGALGKPTAKFGSAPLIERLGLQELISVPVLDLRIRIKRDSSVNIFSHTAHAISF